MTHSPTTKLLPLIGLALLLCSGCCWVTAQRPDCPCWPLPRCFARCDAAKQPELPCVADTTFFGFEGTCWYAWPQPWTACPCPMHVGNSGTELRILGDATPDPDNMTLPDSEPIPLDALPLVPNATEPDDVEPPKAEPLDVPEPVLPTPADQKPPVDEAKAPESAVNVLPAAPQPPELGSYPSLNKDSDAHLNTAMRTDARLNQVCHAYVIPEPKRVISSYSKVDGTESPASKPTRSPWSGRSRIPTPRELIVSLLALNEPGHSRFGIR
ncbi:MAG: hypothetical protein JW888_03105 [Pirellulales bacterium]|nr:hypothetical protein [Pirellulales bacterium]